MTGRERGGWVGGGVGGGSGGAVRAVRETGIFDLSSTISF